MKHSSLRHVLLFLQFWQHCIKFSQNENTVDFDAYCNAIEDLITNEEKLERTIKTFYNAMFDVIDTNHDGYVQENEYEHHFKISRLDPAMAKKSFDAIDTNKVGVLSREEFISAIVEFLGSKEDTPAKFFFGGLVD